EKKKKRLFAPPQPGPIRTQVSVNPPETPSSREAVSAAHNPTRQSRESDKDRNLQSFYFPNTSKSARGTAPSRPFCPEGSCPGGPVGASHSRLGGFCSIRQGSVARSSSALPLGPGPAPFQVPPAPLLSSRISPPAIRLSEQKNQPPRHPIALPLPARRDRTGSKRDEGKRRTRK